MTKLLMVRLLSILFSNMLISIPIEGLKELLKKLDQNVPVDDALKQMGVTSPSLIKEIKDDLSYHAINSGSHNPKSGTDINIELPSAGAVVDAGLGAAADAAGKAAYAISNPVDTAQNMAGKAANALGDGAKALGNMFGGWGR